MNNRYEITSKDIVYRKIKGTSLKARLYQPIGPGPFPAIVEVHGGAWTSNDRTTNAPIHEAVAETGVVVMAIDFRMPPNNMFPDSITDTNHAIRWLKSRANKLNIEATSVGILGTSSGGHQAILNALLPNDPQYVDTTDTLKAMDGSVAFAISCWSVLDPLARYKMAIKQCNQRLVDAHHAFWPSEAAMRSGNPQLTIENNLQHKKPPILLLQGTADDNLPADVAERFFHAYKTINGSVILEKFKNQPHAFVGKDPSSAASLRALNTINNFIHNQTESGQLKKEPELL
ncbi:MAG: alpha/beta hydrolase [Rhodospirillaceae bacterium]|nr:alpha/beta hydrolase [Rhodospirillaceae bacterium]|tara:strand:- start:2070 stop:2933 length:864 start_codon:yes stop_codon:yes gene_type:complete